MSTLNGSINLMKFLGAKKVIANGQKGIFIPTDLNPAIFSGEKGAYASIRVVEKETSFNDRHYTHFMALSISKKQREELEANGWDDDHIKAATPILGNLEAWAPQDNYESVNVSDDDDDMPDDF